MKNLFKFTTAAVALVALASCSSDDLFGGQSANSAAYEEGDLIVNVESLSDGFRSGTRAISDDALTTFNFEPSDKIKVYDDQVFKWDGYKFNDYSKKFEIFTKSDVGTPLFALYPFGATVAGYEGQYEVYQGGREATGVKNTTWNKGEAMKATMHIPSRYTYKESALADGSNGYWCNLPMWGTVISTEGKLETNLKYMTAVLRVSLKNVTSSADIDHLRIAAYKDEARTKQISLSGDFDAVLDTENPENTALQEELGYGEIYVDVASGAQNNDSYVFVPIVPCTNAIVVIYYEDNLNNAVEAKDGKTEKVLKQKTYKRGTLYKAIGAEFEVDNSSPKAISASLAGNKTQTEPVEINVKAGVTTTPTFDDNVITIPAGMKADIILNLDELNTSSSKLYIMDEDIDNQYTGNITVSTKNPAYGGNGIVTQLKAAAVQFVGDFATSGVDIDAYVKELVIGEVEKTTKVNLGGVGKLATSSVSSTVESVYVKEDATVAAITAPEDNVLAEVLVEGKVTGDITVNTNKDVATGVTVNGGITGKILTTGDVIVSDGNVGQIGSLKCYANSLTVAASDGENTVTKAAYVSGNISTATVGAGNIKMDAVINKSEETDAITVDFAGNTTVSALNFKDSKNAATITFADKAYATGNINAPEATVNLKSSKTFEGAITADYLSLNGEAKAIPSGTNTVTTGKLVIQGKASVSDATATNNVYVKLSKEGEAISGTLTIPAENTEGMQIALYNGYINTVDLSAADNNVALKTNAGQIAIAQVNQGAGDEDAKLVPAAASKWDGKVIDKTNAEFDEYRNSTQIWTASQLASLGDAPADAIVKLMNDIDLGTTETWTMPALNDFFNGQDHTITGGKIVAADDKGTGLFSTIAAGKSIQHLTFTGATITSEGKPNVGALVGKALGNVSIWHNVVVNATLNVTGDKAENIGGLVGNAAGKATFGKATDEKGVDVTLSALAGSYNLGGLVGLTNGADINKTTVAITNGITFTPEKKTPGVEDVSDSKAGSIGMFIGKSTGDVTIDKANPKANDKVSTKRTELGFKLNFKGTAPNLYYYLGGYYSEIGQLGDSKSLKVGTDNITSHFGAATDTDISWVGSGASSTEKINWGGTAVTGTNVAKNTFGIYVHTKAYTATDINNQ